MTLSTLNFFLNVMINRKIVRKKGLYYVYAPHDILRKRWLDYFDRIFRSYTAAGHSIQEFLNSQAFIITPQNLGFAPANSESLKKLADGLFSTPDLKPGEMLGLIRATGRIEKYQPVRWVRKDEIK